MKGRRRDLAPAPIDRRVLEREVINVIGKRRLGDGGQSPAICHRRARPKADVRLDLFTTRFLIVLASSLAASRRTTEALALMDEAADLIEARGYASYLPELLRLKGSVLLLMSKVNAADAETCFKQSFEVSSMQGSRAWQLRTATDLASLWAAQGRSEEVRALLGSEGFDTSDLTTAESVLAGLRSTNLSRTSLVLGLRHACWWQTAPRPMSAAV